MLQELKEENELSWERKTHSGILNENTELDCESIQKEQK